MVLTQSMSNEMEQEGKKGEEARQDRPTNGKHPVVVLHNQTRTTGITTPVQILGHILRSLLLDLPLLLVFGLFISTALLHKTAVTYFLPQLKLQKWNPKRQARELSYYHRQCTPNDITAHSTTELRIRPDLSALECTQHMLKHGVSLYPNVLTESTATAVRNYILERNKVEKGWYVIENDFRYSFGLQVNAHDSIRQALHEIAHHDQLQAALTKIVGKNPAVIEFTAITATEGATEQFLHQDVVPYGSALKYVRNFVPSYSLFIPLQNITDSMGSTQVCPGTHQCVNTNMCHDHNAMLVSGGSVWPTGTAALVNQQTFHRGTAHTQGPARVLFILTFAARPRTHKLQLETRQLGQSGSYSLRWNQWGHTMDDFAKPQRHMKEPWTTLRSLGIWKPTNKDWGWDYITVSSMRITNDDNGFHREQLEEFYHEGGFPFLPLFLTPPLLTTDDWETYLMKTLVGLKDWLQQTCLYIHAAYLAVVLCIQAMAIVRRPKRRTTLLRRVVSRLVLTHGGILLAAHLVWRHIESTPWAKNIRYGKAFHAHRTTDTRQDRNVTLPVDNDFLDSHRYHSPYLASYQYILNVNHPGNVRWHRTIHSNAVNYHNLHRAMQQRLTERVLREFTISGRLLRQTDRAKWSVLSHDESLQQAHKDLYKASSPVADFVLTHLEYLQTELEVGIFRETLLHRKHISALLQSLQDDLLGAWPMGPTIPQGACRLSQSIRRVEKSMVLPQRFSSVPPQRTTGHVRSPIPTTLPSHPEPQPPYLGAWIEEGDVVEGQYRGEYNEWYRGVVTSMNAVKDKIDVLYDDGDEDKGLCRLCVRPYVPLKLDEVVAVRHKDGSFYEGRVVAIHDNDRYDVETVKKGLQRKVKSTKIRRFDSRLVEGAVIEAKYQGRGKKWYRGRIAKVNDDGTFDVDYDDEESEYSVKAKHIRLSAW